MISEPYLGMRVEYRNWKGTVVLADGGRYEIRWDGSNCTYNYYSIEQFKEIPPVQDEWLNEFIVRL